VTQFEEEKFSRRTTDSAGNDLDQDLARAGMLELDIFHGDWGIGLLEDSSFVGLGKGGHIGNDGLGRVVEGF